MLAKSNITKLAFDASKTLLIAIATNAILFVPYDQLRRAVYEYLFDSHAPNIAFLPSVFFANLAFNGFIGMIYGIIILFSKKRMTSSCVSVGLLTLFIQIIDVFIRLRVLHLHSALSFLLTNATWEVAQSVLCVFVSIKLIQRFSKE